MRLKRIAAAIAALWVVQASFAHAGISTPYICRGNDVIYHVGYEDGNDEWVFVSAEFAPPRQHEQLEFALRVELAGSGYRFTGQFAEFYGKGDDATIEVRGQRITCFPSEPAMQAGDSPSRGAVGRAGQSLGGILRAGPGTHYERLDGLSEGTPVIIEAYAGVAFEGYEWFEVTVGGRRGFQWGGILCSEGEQIPGIFSQCPR